MCNYNNGGKKIKRQKKIKKNGGNFSNSVKMNFYIQKFNTKRAAPRGIL